ncbi:hypothetical protein BC940DRAFT_335627 [Gongronella butleri]|nr:hypothetical protein BC940DRAFT_335627 [Gongronella butleri]
MELMVVKSKRKASCAVCRSKKIKCDGQQPCGSCVKRGCQDECKVPARRPLGRPPTNAVVNKIIRHRPLNRQDSTLIKDFIFENLMYTIPTASNHFLLNDRTLNLNHLIDTQLADAFGDAVTQLSVSRLSFAPNPFIPDVKMYDLLETYTWTLTEVVNIFTSKISSMPMFAAEEYNFIAAAMYQDMCLKFLGEPLPGPLESPLSTLTTDEAVRLIECFFSISPQCLLLNKTLVLQAFWTDQADPILLAVIYGTTMYFSRLLEGKPVRLWEATSRTERNPFLDYAYVMLLRSSSEATFVKYQAVVLLGMFENTYGFPKRGMSLMALGHMLGNKLGIHNGSFQADASSEVEAELANCCYWSSIRNTVRGSVDVGHVAYWVSQESVPLPPMNIDQSVSYQMEKASGNLRIFKSYFYLVESYYACMVVCKFTYDLVTQFPDVKYNMLYPGNQKSSDRRAAADLPVDELLMRLATSLQHFAAFIAQHKHQWSTFQRYAIETAYHLLETHITLVRPFGQAPEGSSYANSIYDIFASDTTLYRAILNNDVVSATSASVAEYHVMPAIDLVVPNIYTLIDLLKNFIADEKHNVVAPPPHSMMVTVMDTAINVLRLKHQRDPWDDKAMDTLIWLEQLTYAPIWKNWEQIDSARQRLQSTIQDAKLRCSASSGTMTPQPSIAENMPSSSISHLSKDSASPASDALDLTSLLDPLDWLPSVLPFVDLPTAKENHQNEADHDSLPANHPVFQNFFLGANFSM